MSAALSVSVSLVVCISWMFAFVVFEQSFDFGFTKTVLAVVGRSSFYRQM